MSDFIKVGTASRGYPEERNIFSLPFKNAQIVRRYDSMNIANYLYFKLVRKSKPEYNFLHRDFGFNDVQLFHFFNKISFSKTPWITTFETRVPYFKPADTPNKYFELVAGNHCKKLIAISQRAFTIEQWVLDQRKQYKRPIEEKITVIHPPQKQLLNDYNEKSLSNKFITFTLVGRSFFLKGGMEVLEVFDRLLQTHKNIKLNIVSLLEYGDYISQSTASDLAKAKKLISKHPENIVHFERLDNKSVLELYKSSHVSLQPSYHDSYGYAVLEAQACGCPVLSTDICAMPEINNEQCGWLMNIPKDELKDGLWRTEADRKKLSTTLQEQLFAQLSSIINNQDQIKEKGTNAMKRIAKDHSPEDRAALIEKIYFESIN